jgi:hypothetical protein
VSPQSAVLIGFAGTMIVWCIVTIGVLVAGYKPMPSVVVAFSCMMLASLVVCLAILSTGCEAAAVGMQVFGSHPLGPNGGNAGAPQSCITNVQQHAVGTNPYAYQTGFTTCR